MSRILELPSASSRASPPWRPGRPRPATRGGRTADPIARGSDRTVMTVKRLNGTARANLLVPTALSAAAFVLVIVFFAPRFVLWPFIDLDPAEHHPPEFNRAIDTLRQLDQPFMPITNPTNRVINWRLLFPILGHYLHLPPWAFLACRCSGACLCLGMWLTWFGASRAWWAALAAAALFGTTSWFFVSTGWLAYFDSWYMLGTACRGVRAVEGRRRGSRACSHPGSTSDSC